MSSIDLVPTLTRAMGLQTTTPLPGVNLFDDEAIKFRTEVFGECFTHNAVDLDDPAKNLRWRWMVQGDWKLIVPHPPNEPKGAAQLYRIFDDPHEETNLADAHPEQVQKMTMALDAWWDPTAKRNP